MKIIVLTRPDDGLRRVVAEHIVTWTESILHDNGSEVLLANGATIHVLETPDEINRLLLPEEKLKELN